MIRTPALSRVALFFSLFYLASCQPSAPEVDPRLLGKWQLLEGWRNNRQSPSLENIFFEFFPDNNMRSNFNFNGSSEAATFQLKENILKQSNGEMELDYTVESLSDSILILSTTLMDADFRLLLKKEAAAR
jgi:hypothetical protein